MHFIASKCMGPLVYKQTALYFVADVRQAVACVACLNEQLMSRCIHTTKGVYNQQPDSADTQAEPVGPPMQDRQYRFASAQVWLLLSEKALQGAYMQAPKHKPADSLTTWAPPGPNRYACLPDCYALCAFAECTGSDVCLLVPHKSCIDLVGHCLRGYGEKQQSIPFDDYNGSLLRQTSSSQHIGQPQWLTVS